MKKSELLKGALQRMQDRYNRTINIHDADLLWDIMIDVICENLKSKGTVTLRGFGTFNYATSSKRRHHNIHTRKISNSDGKKCVKFTASALLLSQIESKTPSEALQDAPVPEPCA